MKTAKYRKRCFDQIEGIVAENKALCEEKTTEMSAQEERLLDLNRWLADKDRERRGQSCILSSCM